MSLATGRKVWSHYDLYDKYHAFNTIENVAVNDNKLIVREELASYDRREALTMVIDLKTGEYLVH